MSEKVKGSLILHASLYKNVKLVFVALSIDPTVHGNRRIIDFFLRASIFYIIVFSKSYTAFPVGRR